MKKNVVLFLLLFFVFILLSNIVFYVNERAHWVNSSHANLQAKEYFAVGNVIFFYRKILNIFVEIDNPIMSPLNKLQKIVYDKGVQYLPEDDAEKAVWKYKYFYYFYVRKTYFPKECRDFQYDAYKRTANDWSNDRVPCGNRIALLEEFYATIEELGTLPIADHEIEEIRYKIFPLFVSYYAYKYYYYFGQKPGFYMKIRLTEDKKSISRIYKMLDWLTTFKSQWQADEKLKKEIEQQIPVIAVAHYEATLEFLEMILFKMFRDGKLDCNSPHIDRYLENRNLMLGLGDINAPINLIPNGQRETLLDMSFRTWFDMSLTYKLHEECGSEIVFNYPSDAWIEKNKALIEEKFSKRKDI